MKELIKVNDELFNEHYEGVAANGKKVICILDDNCVRYMVLNANGKQIRRREYENTQKETCFRNATKAFNRI